MAAQAIRTFCLVIILALPAAQARATPFGELLREADTHKSSNTRHMTALLAELQRRKSEADPSELRHLRLLQDYRRTITGDYQAALGDAMALVEQAPEPELKYRAALLITNISALNRDYLTGLRYLDRALMLRERVTDAGLRQTSMGVAGTIYNEFGHFDMALAEAERALAEQPDPRNRCFARQVRVRALNGLGRSLDEDSDVHEAIADCAAQREPIAVNAIRATLADYWARTGRRRQAIALLEASLPEAVGTGYTRLVGELRQLLAQYQLEEGDLAAAHAQATAIVRDRGIDANSLAGVVAQRVLYTVALKRGDIAGALDHYRRYAQADKARLDDIKSREYAFQLSRHELKQKNQSIAQLSNQNQLLRLQQEVAKRTAWNFRLIVALLVVLAASVSYWGWRARRTHGSLRQLAETDSLTGLSNRRDFRARSEAALLACSQQARPVSMLLLDLDHFKQINDQCGHSSGDWVLREVARVGRLHCREGDLYGRIGGEEFAMTLIDCDVDAALRIAEQCRRSIADIDANAAGCALPVATSIGVVGSSMSGYDYEALIAHADAAMYRSKVAGRNRVSLYQPPPVPEAGHGLHFDGRDASAMLREY